MMTEKRLKCVFNISSAFLLVLMLLLSKNAGITCDEVLHYNHSVSVYNYFATHGEDQSALNTPVTNLKYYGQSYDCLLYTSDAADEEDSVDLGGRRIIK